MPAVANRSTQHHAVTDGLCIARHLPEPHRLRHSGAAHWDGPGRIAGQLDIPAAHGGEGRGCGGSRSSGFAADDAAGEGGFAALHRLLAADAVDNLPQRGLSGLAVPVFGPLAQASVLLPAWVPAEKLTGNELITAVLGGDPPAPSGKRKPPKQFRVPGGAGTTEQLTGFGLIPSDNGRTATLHTQARTAVPATHDGTADLADALLSAGVLQESDWCGGLERTLSRGLARWADEEKGAAHWRWFGSPLALVVTDDAPAYSTGALLARWRDEMRLPAHKPTGFFGLRFQSPPRPVHVRRVVQDVEAVWPGVGYGMLSMLAMTSVSSVQTYGLGWGLKLASTWSHLDRDALGFESLGFGGDELQDAIEHDEDDPYRFGDCVPVEAAMTPFRLDRLDAAIASGDKCPRLLPVLTAARAVFSASRRAGLRFHALNHCPYLAWQMSLGSRQGLETGRGIQTQHIEHLDRAPVAYTVWDTDNDVMTRMVDDYTEFARSTMQYTDLTWMHCYQAGFAGREPEGGAKWLAAKNRMTAKLAAKHPEAVIFSDPDYRPQPMPDGSTGQAVLALDMVMDILGATDRLLTLLHTPETLAERYRAGNEGAYDL